MLLFSVIAGLDPAIQAAAPVPVERGKE